MSKCEYGSGTVQRGSGIRVPGVICDGCGGWFPGYYHPVEKDMVECPRWEAHVRAERLASPEYMAKHPTYGSER